MKVLISHALSRLWNIRWGDLKEILGAGKSHEGEVIYSLELSKNIQNILKYFRNIFEVIKLVVKWHVFVPTGFLMPN